MNRLSSKWITIVSFLMPHNVPSPRITLNSMTTIHMQLTTNDKKSRKYLIPTFHPILPSQHLTPNPLTSMAIYSHPLDIVIWWEIIPFKLTIFQPFFKFIYIWKYPYWAFSIHEKHVFDLHTFTFSSSCQKMTLSEIVILPVNFSNQLNAFM